MGLIGRCFEGFKEGHCFLYVAVSMLIVEDMEGISRLWVVIFYVSGVLFVTLL